MKDFNENIKLIICDQNDEVKFLDVLGKFLGISKERIEQLNKILVMNPQKSLLNFKNYPQKQLRRPSKKDKNISNLYTVMLTYEMAKDTNELIYLMYCLGHLLGK